MGAIEREGMLFLEALLSGMIVSMAYVCIRKLRRMIKHNLVVIAIEDLLFWIGAAIYLFVQIYNTSDGSIRWYFILGIVLGSVLVIVFCKIKEKSNKKLYVNKGGNSEKNIDKPSRKS